MPYEFSILLLTAASIGFFHTLFGPDHYLPFIVMSRSGKWSIQKTMIITILCGLGHVLSSVVLGFVGISIGTVVTRLEFIESIRGDIAAWGLITFGLLYFLYGLNKALKKEHHKHDMPEKNNITPWVLFLIFILGPCEPLIPILMYPAAKLGIGETIAVASVFSAITISTMLTVVLLTVYGSNRIKIPNLERYTNALAGATILLCGLSIQFLGL